MQFYFQNTSSTSSLALSKGIEEILFPQTISFSSMELTHKFPTLVHQYRRSSIDSNFEEKIFRKVVEYFLQREEEGEYQKGLTLKI